ncbi:MAG: nucleoside-triphosphatase [Gemmatimonadales bacterium]|jgi:nucleoside-triphosphatase
MPNLPAPPRILLTGRPGCGKTTVIRRGVEQIGRDRCAGFYTEEVRERGRRVGFDVVTLAGRRGPLARLGARGPRVGRYGVDLASFDELGVGALERALEAGAPVLVVDELGKMELYSARFVAILEQLFDPAASHAVLGTVMERSHPKVDPLRGRPGVEVIRVTERNRCELPARLGEIYVNFVAGIGSWDTPATGA